MGKMFQAATNYLPAQVSGMMSQDRAFATVRLNISGQRNICALSTYVLTLLTSAPWARPALSHLSACRARGVAAAVSVWVSFLASGCFSHQDSEAASAVGDDIGWTSLHLQPGPAGRRGVCLN